MGRGDGLIIFSAGFVDSIQDKNISIKLHQTIGKHALEIAILNCTRKFDEARIKVQKNYNRKVEIDHTPRTSRHYKRIPWE